MQKTYSLSGAKDASASEKHPVKEKVGIKSRGGGLRTMRGFIKDGGWGIICTRQRMRVDKRLRFNRVGSMCYFF